jgi:hypothetical protein
VWPFRVYGSFRVYGPFMYKSRYLYKEIRSGKAKYTKNRTFLDVLEHGGLLVHKTKGTDSGNRG